MDGSAREGRPAAGTTCPQRAKRRPRTHSVGIQRKKVAGLLGKGGRTRTWDLRVSPILYLLAVCKPTIPPFRQGNRSFAGCQVRGWNGIPVGLSIDPRGGSPTLSRANFCIGPASELTLEEKEAQRGSETHPGSHSLEFLVLTITCSSISLSPKHPESSPCCVPSPSRSNLAN